MYLLDTDVISNLRRKKPHPNLLGWLNQVGWDDLYISPFTITEIQIGIERARMTAPDVALQVSDWLAGLLKDGKPQVVVFDADAAIILGQMTETPALRNFLADQPLSTKIKLGNDLAIAAVAIAGDLTLVTINDRDFLSINEFFPLPGLYNPITDSWHVQPRRQNGDHP